MTFKKAASLCGLLVGMALGEGSANAEEVKCPGGLKPYQEDKLVASPINISLEITSTLYNSFRGSPSTDYTLDSARLDGTVRVGDRTVFIRRSETEHLRFNGLGFVKVRLDHEFYRDATAIFKSEKEDGDKEKVKLYGNYDDRCVFYLKGIKANGLSAGEFP